MASALTMNVPIIGFKFFLDAVEVKRLRLGSWELFSSLLPPSTIFLLLVSNANRILTHESDRARFRDYYTIMKGFL